MSRRSESWAGANAARAYRAVAALVGPIWASAGRQEPVDQVEFVVEPAEQAEGGADRGWWDAESEPPLDVRRPHWGPFTFVAADALVLKVTTLVSARSARLRR